MIKRSWVPTLAMVFVLSALTMWDGACSNNNGGGSVSAQSVLTISPPSTSVSPGGIVQFTALGGVPYTSAGAAPYLYSMVSGTGTIIASTGAYTAPQTDETDTVSVTDSVGAVSYGTVTVGVGASTTGACIVGTNGLQICPGSVTLAEGGTYQFTASGGTDLDYTFAMAGGNGTVTSTGFYTAPEYTETDTIRLTDSAGDLVEATVSVSTSTVPTGSSAGAVEIYRFYNPTVGDHLYSLSPTEGNASNGYTEDDGAVFQVYPTDSMTGTTALYRCRTADQPQTHFISTNPSCANPFNNSQSGIYESILGYIYISETGGLPPLWALTDGHDFLATINPSEGNGNYTSDGIMGYVFGP